MKHLFLFLLPAILFQQTIISQWVHTNGLNDAPVYSFALSGANLFAGTSGSGVFLSTNKGASWTLISLTDEWMINSLAVIGTKVFAGTGWNQGVFLSTDNGTTWTSANTPFGGFSHMVQLGTHLFAGTADEVFVSTDNGTSWASTGLSEIVNCLAISGINLFTGTGEGCCLGGGGRVFLTTNNGTNWNEVTPVLESGFKIHQVKSLVVSNADLYAGTEIRGIFLSTNNGTSWSHVSEGLPWGFLPLDAWQPRPIDDTIRYAPIECLVKSGENLFAGIGEEGFGEIEGGGVFLATNRGTSWTAVNEGLTNKNVHSLLINETHLFAGTDNGVWRRPLVEMIPVELISFTATASGKEVTLNWTTATELNNQGFEVQRKFGSNDFLTVGSIKGNGTTTSPNQYSFVDKLIDGGKYFYRLKQIDFGGTFEYSNVIEVEVRVLDKFTLEKNYPNPFNPVTTIGYVLQEKSNAKVTILNSLGEEIAVLVNEEQDKGYHKVEFNGSKLTSGVYFYRLKAGEFISTKKMILLR